jgi:hypothetical protein
MITSSKVKWYGSILLAGIFIILALLGGNWGTSYSASASVNPDPIIQYISPVLVPIGSPDTPMDIYGLNFEPMVDTKVWISNNCVVIPGRDCGSREFAPVDISPTHISIIVPADMFEAPSIWIVQVVIYVGQTIPTGNYSNPAVLGVWSPDTYLPITHKLSR